MSYLKVKELRSAASTGKESLLKQLTELKKELAALRVAKQVNAAPSKICKIGLIRKNIARVLTVLNQTERENLRKFYADSKVAKSTPKALKAKLTKSRRLALKPSEKNRKTRAQARRAAKFPLRVFAVKI